METKIATTQTELTAILALGESVHLNLCGWPETGDIYLRGAKTGDIDLRGAETGDIDLRGAKTGYIDLRGAETGYIDLKGAKTGYIYLRRANTGYIYLTGTKINGYSVHRLTDQRKLLARCAQTILAHPETLNMSNWHSCPTTHCLAGHAVVIGEAQEMEKYIGPEMAGLILLGPEAAKRFFDSNKSVLSWLASKGHKNDCV